MNICCIVHLCLFNIPYSFVQDIGQRLKLSLLTINTAVVYCQRFYMVRTFQQFQRFKMASAAFFLASKVAEFHQDWISKSEHIVMTANKILKVKHSKEVVKKQVDQLVDHENLLLQTLGFDLEVVHPHSHIANFFFKYNFCFKHYSEDCDKDPAFCHMGARSVVRKAYFVAQYLMLQTTLCLRYSPETVSGMCIHLAAKWSGYSVQEAYTTESLEQISDWGQFIAKCPLVLRNKIEGSTPKYFNTPKSSTPMSSAGSTPKDSSTPITSTPKYFSQTTASKRKGDELELSPVPRKKFLQGF